MGQAKIGPTCPSQHEIAIWAGLFRVCARALILKFEELLLGLS